MIPPGDAKYVGAVKLTAGRAEPTRPSMLVTSGEPLCESPASKIGPWMFCKLPPLPIVTEGTDKPSDHVKLPTACPAATGQGNVKLPKNWPSTSGPVVFDTEIGPANSAASL